MLFAHTCALLLNMYLHNNKTIFLDTDFKKMFVFSLDINIQWLVGFDWHTSPAPRSSTELAFQTQRVKVTIFVLRGTMFTTHDTVCNRERGDNVHYEWKYQENQTQNPLTP